MCVMAAGPPEKLAAPQNMKSAETTHRTCRPRGFAHAAGLVEEEGGRRRERAIDLWSLNSRLSRVDLNVPGALADASATSVGAGATIRGRGRRCSGDCCCDSTSCENQCDETRFDCHFFFSLVDESVGVMMPSFVHPVPPDSGWWIARVAPPNTLCRPAIAYISHARRVAIARLVVHTEYK